MRPPHVSYNTIDCFLDSVACVDVACDETQQYRARGKAERLVSIQCSNSVVMSDFFHYEMW